MIWKDPTAKNGWCQYVMMSHVIGSPLNIQANCSLSCKLGDKKEVKGIDGHSIHHVKLVLMQEHLMLPIYSTPNHPVASPSKHSFSYTNYSSCIQQLIIVIITCTTNIIIIFHLVAERKVKTFIYIFSFSVKYTYPDAGRAKTGPDASRSLN
jgi:hypothetical protein